MTREKLLIALLGFLAGCSVSYLYTKTMSDRNMEKIVSEYEEELSALVTEKIQTDTVPEQLEEDAGKITTGFIEPDRIKEKPEEKSKDPRPPLTYQPKSLTEQELILYNGKPLETEDDEVIGLEDYMKKQMAKLYAERDPHAVAFIISIDEVEEMRNQPGWDSVTLTYYDLDETLCDEQKDPITDPSEIIDPEALNNFGVGSESPDIVYVANTEYQIVYEIIREDEEYVKMVLGYGDMD